MRVVKPQTLRVLVFPIESPLWWKSQTWDGRTRLAKGSMNAPVSKKMLVLVENKKITKRAPYKYVGINLDSARVTSGVNHVLTTCPRCGQTLVDRGYAYYCQYGCAREFPKLGALVSDRMEYERRSGNVTAMHALEGRGGMQSSDARRERNRKYAKVYDERKRRERRKRLVSA